MVMRMMAGIWPLVHSMYCTNDGSNCISAACSAQVVLNALPLHVSTVSAAIQARLGDSNRNLAARTLILLGELAKAMGAAFDKQCRPIVAPSLSNISDTKKQVRGELITVDLIVNHCITARPALAFAGSRCCGNHVRVMAGGHTARPHSSSSGGCHGSA